jgi:ribosome-associated heat shock protein Hsp15
MVRVVALGSRRGPASEAQSLYQEIAPPVRRTETAPEWEPLLAEDDSEG